MKTFTDNAGRTWTVAVTVDAIKRVRSLVNVDLLEVVEGKLIDRLYRDPILLCDVLYAVCKPEADAKNITDEEFGRAMAGDAIDHATKALLEELADFSPSPKDRANLRSVIQKTAALLDLTRDRIAQRIAGGAIEQAVERALAELPPVNVGDSSPSAPASLVSIPAG